MKKIYCIIAVILVFINVFPQSYPRYKQVDEESFIEPEFSSWGNYPMKGKTFFVISGDPQISNNDVEFLYYRDFITQALIYSGAIPSLDYDSADVCILLDYGIFDASYVATRSIPVWGKTGISSVRTTTTTSGSVYGSSTSYGSATAYSSGNSTYGYGSGSTYASATGSSTTYTTQNYNYDYGVTGYRQESYNVKKYRAHLNLYAYDNTKKDGEPIMLWKINATCDHPKLELRNLFPYMVYSCRPYMGKDSDGKKNDITIQSFCGFVEAMKEKIFLQKNIIPCPLTKPSHCVYSKTYYERFKEEYKSSGNRFAETLQCYLIAIQLDEDATYIFLSANDYGRENHLERLGKGSDSWYIPITDRIKIGNLTHLKYKDQNIPCDSVFVPMEHRDWRGASKVADGYSIGKERGRETIILLKFPVKLEREDNFDLFLSFGYSDCGPAYAKELPPMNVTIKHR